MAMKEILVFFACFSVLSKFGNSVNIQCNYGMNSWTSVGSFYKCKIQNTLNITSRESAVINSETGDHDSDKSNADVTCFYSDDSSHVIEYFPRNLENIYKNLKMININKGRLKEIQQSDLRPFTKLVCLSLEDNDIEFLEDGLFVYNPELVYIDIGNNKIIHIETQVFDNLNNLVWLYLYGNTCIDMIAENNQTIVKEVISQITVKCQQYPDKHSINFINDKFDRAQFELLKRITDLSKSTATKSEIAELRTLQMTIEIKINQLISSQNTNDDKTLTVKDFSKYIIGLCSVLCLFNIVLIIIYKRFIM